MFIFSGFNWPKENSPLILLKGDIGSLELKIMYSVYYFNKSY